MTTTLARPVDQSRTKAALHAARQAAYRDPALTPCAKAVLAYLGTRQAQAGGWAAVKRKDIAKALGRCARTVDYALAQLHAQGYIDRKPPPRCTTEQGEIRCAGPASYRLRPRPPKRQKAWSDRRAIGCAPTPLQGVGSPPTPHPGKATYHYRTPEVSPWLDCLACDRAYRRDTEPPDQMQGLCNHCQ